MHRRFKVIYSKELTGIVFQWVELWVLFVFYVFAFLEML